jgi:hypothetical protein
MAQNPGEILVGAGLTYTAPVGTAFPAVTVTPSGSWTQPGYSEAGWTINIDQKRNPITPDELFDAVAAPITSRAVTITGNFLQASLPTLAYAVSGTTTFASGSPNTLTWTPQIPGVADTTYAYYLRLKAPTVSGIVLERDVQIPAAIPQGAPKILVAKGKPQLMAADFLALDLTGVGYAMQIVDDLGSGTGE